ncbi:MAG: glycosyltransferase 87 family protein [Arthrobacter sp.]|nr:glycosyltransferase 87 family protein [Arthrobacter sp.]
MSLYRAKPAVRKAKPYAVASLLLLACAALTRWMVAPENSFTPAPLVASCIYWLVLVAAVRSLRHVPPRRIVVVIVAGSVLLGVAAVSGPPRTSNDSARYAWDGIVEKAAISPYAYVPAADSLAALRPEWLFRPGTAGDDGKTVCPADLFGTESVASAGYPSGDPLCTAINRPQVPTIYPPAAEIYFLAVRAAVPDTVGYLPSQLGGWLISTAVTLMVLSILAKTRGPLHLAAAWSWSPLVQLEAVNNAHVDVLACALMLAAAMLLVRGKPLSSGAAFGAAVATKLIPVIAAPALLFRRPAAFVASAAGSFALVYVPYVLAAGAGVFGFLPGYLKEEGYSQGGGARFGLAQLVSAGPWPMLLSGAALAAVALWTWRSTGPGNLWQRQATLIGLTLLIVSPGYPWYALMLLPFVVLSRRWEYITVIVALDVLYMVPTVPPFGANLERGVLVAAALAVAAGAWRRRRSRYAAAGTPQPDSAATGLLP